MRAYPPARLGRVPCGHAWDSRPPCPEWTCARASPVLLCGTLVAHMERRPCGETGYIRSACHKASVCVLVCFLVAMWFALPHGHRGPLRLSCLPSPQTTTAG